MDNAPERASAFWGRALDAILRVAVLFLAAAGFGPQGYLALLFAPVAIGAPASVIRLCVVWLASYLVLREVYGDALPMWLMTLVVPLGLVASRVDRRRGLHSFTPAAPSYLPQLIVWCWLGALVLALFRPFPAGALLLLALGLLLHPAAAALGRGSRTTWGNAALLMLSCLLGLGLLEAGARLVHVPREATSELITPHPTRWFTLAPRAQYEWPIFAEGNPRVARVVISAQGLRDREYWPKEAGETRVLVLGDSMVMGWGTEADDSIPRQLEKELREETGRDAIYAVNGGVYAYGPWQSLDLLQEKAPLLKPDVVVHVLFPFNDIQDTLLRDDLFLEAYDRQSVQYRYNYRVRGTWQPALERWLRRHCYALNLLADRTGWPPYGDIASFFNAIRLSEPAPLPEYPDSKLLPPFLEASRAELYPMLETGIDRMLADVEAMQRYCDAQGIAFLVALLPSIFDLSEETLARAIEEEDAPAIYERGHIYRVILWELRKRQMAVVSLMAPLEEAMKTKWILLPNDIHLNRDGARTCAEAIADRMLLEGMAGLHRLRRSSNQLPYDPPTISTDDVPRPHDEADAVYNTAP